MLQRSLNHWDPFPHSHPCAPSPAPWAPAIDPPPTYAHSPRHSILAPILSAAFLPPQRFRRTCWASGSGRGGPEAPTPGPVSSASGSGWTRTDRPRTPSTDSPPSSRRSRTSEWDAFNFPSSCSDGHLRQGPRQHVPEADPGSAWGPDLGLNQCLVIARSSLDEAQKELFDSLVLGASNNNHCSGCGKCPVSLPCVPIREAPTSRPLDLPYVEE